MIGLSRGKHDRIIAGENHNQETTEFLSKFLMLYFVLHSTVSHRIGWFTYVPHQYIPTTTVIHIPIID